MNYSKPREYLLAAIASLLAIAFASLAHVLMPRYVSPANALVFVLTATIANLVLVRILGREKHTRLDAAEMEAFKVQLAACGFLVDTAAGAEQVHRFATGKPIWVNWLTMRCTRVEGGDWDVGHSLFVRLFLSQRGTPLEILRK